MAQIVANAQALGAALHERGIPMLGSHKAFTRTHQVIADVSGFGGGLEVAHRLAGERDHEREPGPSGPGG